MDIWSYAPLRNLLYIQVYPKTAENSSCWSNTSVGCLLTKRLIDDRSMPWTEIGGGPPQPNYIASLHKWHVLPSIRREPTVLKQRIAL